MVRSGCSCMDPGTPIVPVGTKAACRPHTTRHAPTQPPQPPERRNIKKKKTNAEPVRQVDLRDARLERDVVGHARLGSGGHASSPRGEEGAAEPVSSAEAREAAVRMNAAHYEEVRLPYSQDPHAVPPALHRHRPPTAVSLEPDPAVPMTGLRLAHCVEVCGLRPPIMHSPRAARRSRARRGSPSAGCRAGGDTAVKCAAEGIADHSSHSLTRHMCPDASLSAYCRLKQAPTLTWLR